jgi:glutathione S-transferase
MKLHYSATSPYVRKVMVCALMRGIAGLLDKQTANPHQSPAALLADNPLSKVPALVADDGTAIYDSPVICEYLDTIGSGAPLFPPTGSSTRLKAMVRQAAADGILDAAVGRRLHMAHPQDDGRKAFDARQKLAVERTLAALEQDPPRGLGDIGSISIACALGYLDFRFAHEPWRDACPKLAAWFAEVSKLAPLAETVPVG